MAPARFTLLLARYSMDCTDFDPEEGDYAGECDLYCDFCECDDGGTKLMMYIRGANFWRTGQCDLGFIQIRAGLRTAPRLYLQVYL